MTKQAVWTFRKFFFPQFDTKFASKQQRLAKIGTILWLLLSTQISQVWHTTRRDENAECDMHGLEGFTPLQGVQECSIPCFRKISKLSNQQWV